MRGTGSPTLSPRNTTPLLHQVAFIGNFLLAQLAKAHTGLGKVLHPTASPTRELSPPPHKATNSPGLVQTFYFPSRTAQPDPGSAGSLGPGLLLGTQTDAGWVLPSHGFTPPQDRARGGGSHMAETTTQTAPSLTLS